MKNKVKRLFTNEWGFWVFDPEQEVKERNGYPPRFVRLLRQIRDCCLFFILTSTAFFLRMAGDAPSSEFVFLYAIGVFFLFKLIAFVRARERYAWAQETERLNEEELREIYVDE